MNQVKVHSTLAQVLVSSKEYTRSYALWTALRMDTNHSGHLDKQDVIDLALRETGKAQSTIYTWLSQGESIFWNSEGGRLWLIGKEKVFDYFLGKGVKPGRVILVPAELILNERLHVVRSNLSATWVTSDNGKIAARITRRNVLQRVPERTQIEYDKTSEVKIKPIVVRSEKEKKQLPNLYIRPDSFYTLNTDKHSKRQFFGHRGTDFNAAESAKVNNAFDSFSCVEKHSKVPNESQKKFGGNRMYFSNSNKAYEMAEYRKLNQISLPVYLLTNRSTSDTLIVSIWLH